MGTIVYMITLENIKKRLAEEIKASKLSQSEIAKRLGVHHSQISCYVHGKKSPALDTFANLCKVLDVDPADILCTNENK
ncbi:MAG: helix-turn-helix transcriptional regulator [Clostridia bacterium]|nr:helix-turn-helix transcriptional regulator [Clostridia bacterium]